MEFPEQGLCAGSPRVRILDIVFYWPFSSALGALFLTLAILLSWVVYLRSFFVSSFYNRKSL